jgi:ADP-heptose:LPS heptosyltransferase
MEDKNLLILHQGALGDFVLTFPALIRLQKNFKHIDAICKSSLGHLAVQLNLINRWYALDSAIVASLFSNDIDVRIKEILISYHTIVVVSFSEQLRQTIQRISGQRVCRIPPRPNSYKRIHVADHILTNFVQCGLIANDEQCALQPFQLNQQQQRDATTKSPLKILLHPGAGSVLKMWPLAKFLRLEALLESKGCQSEYVIGPAEMFLKEELLACKDDLKTIHTPGDLAALAALIKTADALIGNDSGVSHLAAFLGLPTVTIFGPSDPQRWKPYGRAVQIVYPELDCSPCFDTHHQGCEGIECFDNVSPEMVMGALYKAFEIGDLAEKFN